MKLYQLPGEIKKVNRLRQIATTLVKYQLMSASEKLHNLSPLALLSRVVGQPRVVDRRRPTPYLVRKVIQELGTTYIKFGQWLSVRPDFVPPEVIAELEQLQDRLPPVSFKITKRTIEQETGKPIDSIFSQFDRYPLSTASIAQVHRGVLKTGEEVAVKVQHPNLKQLIRVDLSVLGSLAAWAVTNWPHLAFHRPEDLISSFKATLMDEIDFTVEAKNQSRIGQMFNDTPWVRVPKVHWEYSTERLLIMEYLHGLKLTQQELFPKWGLDGKILAQRLSTCMFRQIFENGFFHSDPHPGNILFMKDNQIGLVDFGIVGKYGETLRNKFLDWFYAVIYRDVDLFVDTFLEVGKPYTAVDKIQFRNDCLDYIDEMHFQPAGRISFAKVLATTNRILYRHKISTPPTFLFFFKAISTAEGVARRVDPEYDWRDDWGPKIAKLIRARYSVSAVAGKYWKVLKDYERLIVNCPEDFRDVIKRLKEGKFETEMHMPELSGYVDQIRVALHKLSIGLIVSSVIFGLFYLGRGREGSEFFSELFRGLTSNWSTFLGVFLTLALALLYFRKR